MGKTTPNLKGKNKAIPTLDNEGPNDDDNEEPTNDEEPTKETIDKELIDDEPADDKELTDEEPTDDEEPADDEELIDDDEEFDELDEEPVGESSKRKRGRPLKATKALPAIPAFMNLKHKKPYLPNPSIVIPGHHSEVPSIIEVFWLFFPDTMLKTIVINTNYYTAVKGAGEKGREWKNLTESKLLIWIAICIYFGLFCANRPLEWIWDKDPQKPAHRILKYMILFRFQQIKWFLHVSLHGYHKADYYAKVEPLLSHIQKTS